MTITAQELNSYIRSRKSTKPEQFTRKTEIPREILNSMLENAIWAPSHKKTQPWLFKVFEARGLERLSEYMGDYYKKTTPESLYSENKFQQALAKPLKSSCVIAICFKPNPESGLPEWEELAAIACAVENFWLSLEVNGLAGFWSTPKSMLEADSFLNLNAGERCLGVFYVGYAGPSDVQRKRTSLEDKVAWISQ